MIVYPCELFESLLPCIYFGLLDACGEDFPDLQLFIRVVVVRVGKIKLITHRAYYGFLPFALSLPESLLALSYEDVVHQTAFRDCFH